MWVFLSQIRNLPSICLLNKKLNMKNSSCFSIFCFLFKYLQFQVFLFEFQFYYFGSPRLTKKDDKKPLKLNNFTYFSNISFNLFSLWWGRCLLWKYCGKFWWFELKFTVARTFLRFVSIFIEFEDFPRIWRWNR